MSKVGDVIARCSETECELCEFRDEESCCSENALRWLITECEDEPCSGCKYYGSSFLAEPCKSCSRCFTDKFELKPKPTRADKFMELIKGTEFEGKYFLNSNGVPMRQDNPFLGFNIREWWNAESEE